MVEKGESPSELIDARIAELGDWRGEMLGRVRALVKEADPQVVEEWKWAKSTSPGTPVWSHGGLICTGETFNASLEGKTRRAIDLHEGDEIDEEALKALIRAAVALNQAKARD
jgi:hypothetical protein